jgi:endo-1,4-beta-xylanase
MQIKLIRPALSGCLLWLGVSFVAAQQTVEAQYVRPEGPTLRELAEAREFHIGANFPNLYRYWREAGKFGPRRFDPEAAIAKDHFTIMTAGWESFPGHTWKGEGVYDFDGTDRYIAWCEQNGILFHAHGLGYVFRAGWPFGKLPVTTDRERKHVRQVYEQYVSDTVSHFKQHVYLWDVCNEHLFPPYQSGGWLMWKPDEGPRGYWKAYDMDPRDPEYGYDWYVKSFSIAHDADPAARLILLDFNNEIVCRKSDTMYNLARTLLAKRVPLHGIGFQMHINTECKRVMWKKQTREPGGHDLPNDEYFASMRDNIRRFTDLGLEVWITEMSVDVDPTKPLEEQLDRQAEIYGRVFEVCLENPGMKGIKLWGIMDDIDRRSGQQLRPYLFDAEGRAKPAFYAVQQALAKKQTGNSQ